jgi:hypothetical protein
MQQDTANRPDTTEQYQTAANTSNLKVDVNRRGAADVLIASGWSASRLGMALLRLHSEWDAAAKPKRPAQAQIDAAAERLKRQDEQARLRWGPPNPKAPKPRPALLRAREEAEGWYVNELRILACSLRSRSAVWEQLALWSRAKGVSPETVAEALLHWLDPTCPVCEGHGFKKVPGQPALSARRCEHDRCAGGRLMPSLRCFVVLDHIENCTVAARQALKRNLSNMRQSRKEREGP